MGRISSDGSESPAKGRSSPRRLSPYRRESSSARHKRSQMARSPAGDKPSSRTRSPKHAKSRASPSPSREKPINPSSRTRSPKRVNTRVSRSPMREKPPSRARSPKLARSRSPLPHLHVKEKLSSRTKSPLQQDSRHLESRSPSPRTKRLKRAQADNKAEKISEKGHEKNDGKEVRVSRKEREVDKESPPERRVRRVGTDAEDNGSSKSRNVRSTSPSDHHRNRHRSRSPPAAKSRAREEKHEKNYGKEVKAARKEREVDRESPPERRERRVGTDAEDNGSSKWRHVRSSSPSDHHRSRHRSRSPAAKSRAHEEVNNSRREDRRSNDDDSVAQMKATVEALEAKDKQKPSFELSGKLAAETNRVRGVTLLFTEPLEAQKPDIRWRLYVFKSGEMLNEPLYVHRQTCYLFGRERRVADIPTDHPSCSKQHAVLQYRLVDVEQNDGTLSKKVRPYIMDLGSTNGTFINENRIEPQRYYELFEKDTIKFGNSSREYVLLHENSAGT